MLTSSSFFPFGLSHEIISFFAPAVGAVRRKLVCLVICQEFKSNTQLRLVGVRGGEDSEEEPHTGNREGHCLQSGLSWMLLNVVGVDSCDSPL